MSYWRVASVDPARTGPWEPGGELHLEMAWQGNGRFDIPGRALTLYVAEAAAAAVGEVFARFAVWNEAMLISGHTGNPLSLVEFDVDLPAANVVELDDSHFLASRNYRPSDIVARNRTRTQEIAAELWLAGNGGARWWSYHRPEWRVLSLWAKDEPEPWKNVVSVKSCVELDLDHAAVQIAADVIHRTIDP